MSDDPYGYYGGANTYGFGGPDDQYANIYDPNAAYSYGNAPAVNLGYGGGTGGLYDYGGSGSGYYPTGAYDSGAYDVGGAPRDFWDRTTDWLGSDKGQRALSQLSGFSSGLLKGGGPSLQPRNFYSALGEGTEGLQKGTTAYDESAYRRAQTGALNVKSAQDAAWNQTLAGEARNATGLPPGYGASGTTGPAAAAPGAGYGGAPTGGGGGDFQAYAPLIRKYESRDRPYVGTGGTDLSNAPLSATGFPQWAGIPVGQNQRSTAAGLYQITQSTWDPIAAELGIKDFSPESQQRVAEALYARRGLDPWLPYNKGLAAAIGRGEAPNPFRVPPSPSDAGTPVAEPGPMPGAAPAGLAGRFPGVAAVRPGILPGAPVAPVITAPPPIAAAPAPAATSGTTAPPPVAAEPRAPPSAPREQWVAVGDSIAREFVEKGKLPGKTALDPTDLGADAAASRSPQQVVDFIRTALAYDPDYFKGKNVLLSTGVSNDPSQIGLVKDQLALLQGPGKAANVHVVGVGSKAGKEAGRDYDLRQYNPVLQQIAERNGASWGGALPAVVHPAPGYYQRTVAQLTTPRRTAQTAGGEDGGGGGPGGTGEIAPVPENPEPTAAGDVPGVVPGLVPPPSPAAATPSPPPPAPGITVRPAGPMSLPGGVPADVAPAATVAPLGRPISMPGGQPYVAPAPALPAAPAPGVTVPGAGAPVGAAPAPVMPGAIAGAPVGVAPAIPAATVGGPALPAPPSVAPSPRPLPMPNLSQVPVPAPQGLPPYDVEMARRAQVLALAAAATGKTLPGYLGEQAGLPGKALEQQWKNQNTAYDAQLKAAQAQWQAASDLQKQEIAHGQGLQTEEYKARLNQATDDWKQGRRFNPATGQVEPVPGAIPTAAAAAGATEQAKKDAEALAEFDRPREYKFQDNTGAERTIVATPRQMGATPPSRLGAAPGGAQAQGTPGTVGGYPSKIAPGRQEELTAEGKRLGEVATQIHTEANTAKTGRADLDMLAAQGPNIAMPGPLAPYAQMFNRVALSVAGINAPQVASYEMAQNLMGGMMRTALRQSDPNPTERQQAMMLASMPTPESSPTGFQQGIRHMQGLADWRIYREQALTKHQDEHEGSAAGFEKNFKMSAIPFVVDRMTPPEKTAYFAEVNRNDPSGKTMGRLIEQLKAIKDADYSYRY